MMTWNTLHKCNNCRPDTAECSGTNSYLQYVLKDGTFEANCLANMAQTAVEHCWSLKWYCHDPGAQNRVPMDGPGEPCAEWATIGCCYAGDNGAGCDQAATGQDLSEVRTFWFDATGECNDANGNSELDDLSVTCEVPVTEAPGKIISHTVLFLNVEIFLACFTLHIYKLIFYKNHHSHHVNK